MKVTNLRPKNGAYFEIDEVGDVLFRYPNDGGATRYLPEKQFNDWFDFDVVHPEYQIGDLVTVKIPEGKLVKGFVADKAPDGLMVAVEHWEDTLFMQDSYLITQLGRWEIVGLWEQETKE